MKKTGLWFVLVPALAGGLYWALHSTPSPTPSAGNPTWGYGIGALRGKAWVLPAGQSALQPAQAGQTLLQGDQIAVGGNSTVDLALNDEARLRLSEGTTLTVRELKPNATSGFLSRLELLRGRVLSAVGKLSQSRSVFEIDAGGVVTGVRGTIFEVDYEPGRTAETGVFRGRVEVKKGALVQEVPEKKLSAYAFSQGRFLPQRDLNAAELELLNDWGKAYPGIPGERASLGTPQAPPGVPTAPAPASPNGRIGIVLLHGKNRTAGNLKFLVNVLESRGFQVEAPTLPWAKGILYAAKLDESLGEVDKSIADLKARGAGTILLGGMGLGAHMALVYAGSQGGIAGLVLVNPSHYPESFALNRKSPVAASVDQARRMVAQGQGAQAADFWDRDDTDNILIHCGAENYLSFVDPQGPGAMRRAVEGLKQSLPVLLISESHPTKDGKALVFDKLPANPKSLFERTPYSSPRDLILKSGKIIADWVQTLKLN